MDYFYVKFGDPSCIGFIVRKDRQTDRGKNPSSAWVMREMKEGIVNVSDVVLHEMLAYLQTYPP